MNPGFTDFFQFAAQCCDAQNYLLVGEVCATTGDCYNDLRPLGATYWFSLPYRFGWPAETLLYLHIALMLISISLSVIAAHGLAAKLLNIGKQQAPIKSLVEKPWLTLALLVASTLIHMVFLYPVLRNALTDAPASLFALIATWLLLMTPDNNPVRMISLTLSGLLLGMAAWFRVFYLYPLIGVISVWMILWVFNRRHRYADLTLLSALFILALQYQASWKQYGQIEFLPPNPGLVEWHINTKYTGSDSVLPGYEFPAYAPCKHYQTPKDAFTSRDLPSLLCVFAGKIHFYLGSYSPETYWNPDSGDVLPDYNFLLPTSAHSNSHTAAINIRQEPYATATDNNAVRVWKNNYQKDGEITQWLELFEDSKYKISFLAWSPVNYQYIILGIRDHKTKEDAYGGGCILTSTPRECSLGKYLPMHGVQEIVLHYPAISPESDEAKKTAAAGIKLNEGYFYLSNVKLERINLNQMRYWSLLMLFAHFVAFASVFVLLICYRYRFNSNQWMALFFLLLSCGEAVALVPEQRYAISVMITVWILFLSSVQIWIMAINFKPAFQH